MWLVVSGDTLLGIALQYDVSMDDLVRANSDVLDFNNLDFVPAGKLLTIPQNNVSVGYDCTPLPPRSSVEVYVVSNDEKYFCLARKFGISITTLLNANPHIIGQDALQNGTTIYVPPSDGAIYVVTEQDVNNGVVLTDIAKWYNISLLNAIVDWQGQPVSLPLATGQQLFLPGADELALPFQSSPIVADQPTEPPVGDTGSGNVVATPSGIIPSPNDGLSYRLWNTAIGQQDPGYCPLVDGGGWTGSFSWPADNHVIHEGRDFQLGHNGIDLDMPEGSSVYAAQAGYVVWAGYSSFGGGNMVILAHGAGWRTYYAHLSTPLVSCGQYVGQGSLIALSGQTGTSWYHLHFEVQLGSVPQNPHNWLP